MVNDKELIAYLSGFITEQRLALFNKVIESRTRYISVVLEDIYQSQNASAVLRTCDCFGIQNVHVIENKNEFKLNPEVTLGSSKWLSIKKHNEEQNNTKKTISFLREQGYRIVATTPHINDVELEQFDLSSGPIALFFGTELKGLSETVIDNADCFLKIPMFGFTESFNISVSAAIILHHLTHKLRNSNIDWKLGQLEHDALILNWLKGNVKRADMLVNNFLAKNHT